MWRYIGFSIDDFWPIPMGVRPGAHLGFDAEYPAAFGWLFRIL